MFLLRTRGGSIGVSSEGGRRTCHVDEVGSTVLLLLPPRPGACCPDATPYISARLTRMAAGGQRVMSLVMSLGGLAEGLEATGT